MMRNTLTLLETNKAVYTITTGKYGTYYIGCRTVEINTANNIAWKTAKNAFAAWPTDSKLISIYDLHMTTVWTKP